MAKLFVIIGEYGEYEGRTTFVSGVFSSEQAARAAATEAHKRRRTYDAWYEEMNKLHKLRYPPQWLGRPNPPGYVPIDKMPEYIAADKPPYEFGEVFNLVVVESDTWNSGVYKEVEIEDREVAGG